MKTLLLFALAILASLPLRAATLDEANAAFAAGKFHASTQALQSILAEKGYSAPVLFDLGNSLYREGDLPQAILAYKRAQWLAPDDADIAANLQLAQKQANVTTADPLWADRYTQGLSTSGWVWLASAGWTILCLSLLARALVTKWRNAFSISAFAGLVILVATAAAALLSSRGLNQAVVVGKNASALISPFPAAQSVFTPAPGETVTVQKAYNNFLWVTEPSGKSGWMSKDQVSPVVSS